LKTKRHTKLNIFTLCKKNKSWTWRQ